MNQKRRSNNLVNNKGITTRNNLAVISKESTAGITLIALVVTIIVLIILAGVSISLVLKDNGIIKKADEAKEITKLAELKEKLELEKIEMYTSEDISLSKYLEILIDKNIISESNIEDTDIINNKYIVLENKYKFLLKYEKNDIEIIYEGEEEEIPKEEIPKEEVPKEEKITEYFYNNGIEEEEIEIQYYAGHAINAEKKEDSIEITKYSYGHDYGHAFISTKNKINIEKYEKIYLKIIVDEIINVGDSRYSLLQFGLTNEILTDGSANEYISYKNITEVGEQLIEIDTSDLTGEYYILTLLKGTRSKITEIYGIVSAEEEQQKIKRFTINRGYDENGQIKLTATAISKETQQKINGKYEYYYREVGTERYTKLAETTEESYIITNLDNGKNYELYVIAYDEYGNSRKSTNTVMLKYYIYNLGEQYEEITGGLEGFYETGTDSSIGSYTISEDYIEVETHGTWCQYRINTKNEIDYRAYNKLYIDCDITYINNGYSRVYIDQVNGVVGNLYSGDQTKGNFSGILEIDISNLSNKNSKIGIVAANCGSIKIRRMWFE